MTEVKIVVNETETKIQSKLDLDRKTGSRYDKRDKFLSVTFSGET